MEAQERSGTLRQEASVEVPVDALRRFLRRDQDKARGWERMKYPSGLIFNTASANVEGSVANGGVSPFRCANIRSRDPHLGRYDDFLESCYRSLTRAIGKRPDGIKLFLAIIVWSLKIGTVLEAYRPCRTLRSLLCCCLLWSSPVFLTSSLSLTGLGVIQ